MALTCWKVCIHKPRVGLLPTCRVSPAYVANYPLLKTLCELNVDVAIFGYASTYMLYLSFGQSEVKLENRVVTITIFVEAPLLNIERQTRTVLSRSLF